MRQVYLIDFLNLQVTVSAVNLFSSVTQLANVIPAASIRGAQLRLQLSLC